MIARRSCIGLAVLVVLMAVLFPVARSGAADSVDELKQIRLLAGDTYGKVILELTEKPADEKALLYVAHYCSLVALADPWLYQPYNKQPIAITDSDGRSHEVLITHDLERTKLIRQAALRKGEALITALKGEMQNGETASAPFALLAPRPLVAEAMWGEADVDAAEQGYLKHPSTLLAIAYLEVGLLQRYLGDAASSRHTVEEAISTLKLMDVDFRDDLGFRKRLPMLFNFGRPETALLVLAGELAEEAGERDKAVSHYELIIERDPAGPFSWDAFLRIKMMDGASDKRLAELQGILVDVYPCISGCVPKLFFEEAMPTKEEFEKRLPRIIQSAIERKRKLASRSQESQERGDGE